jgi:UDP-N-acetylmuramate dehydrogenase
MQIQHNISLKQYNTFGINTFTKLFAVFKTVDELTELLSTYTNNILVLGGGSNILFTKNFDGIVLKNELSGISLVKEDTDYYYVKAAAGEVWHNFVLHCIQQNYNGLENLSLIPGCVGASPMQNIGAYGVEIKDIFYELEALHIHEKNIVTFNNKDCEFGYRESIFKNKFKNQFIILNVTFKLHKKNVFNISYGAIKEELGKMNIAELNAKAISDVIIAIRSSKLPNPAIIGNAGSFFKNPVIPTVEYKHLLQQYSNLPGYSDKENFTKIPAAWLIEYCGYKGYKKNDVGCHTKQALVLVNYGNANGLDVYNLSEEIIQTVYHKFKILLQREVNII